MKKALRISILLWMSIGMFVSCSKEDDGIDDAPILQTDPPIILDCDYFMENRTLVNNPRAAVDYIITCKMRVAADITVEPGVVIEFEQDAGIVVDDFNTVSASFSAKGTEEMPIIFRGVVRDKGYWRGILFDSGSTKNELDFVQIDGAGGEAFNSNNDHGSIIVWANSKLKISNSVISNSMSFGLNAGYKNSNIQLQNNTFKNNEVPVKISAQYIDEINNSIDFIGNTVNFVQVESGSFAKPTTWKKINVPYMVLNSSTYGYSGGIDVNNLLTVEPGVTIEFEPNTKLKITENGGGIKAIGTETDPIIFTAVNKVQNGWIGFYFDSAHPMNEIAFAEFHYSGKTTGTGESESGTIRLWYNNLLYIHDVTFRNINGCAINYGILHGQGDNPTFTYDNLTVDSGACEVKCFGQGC